MGGYEPTEKRSGLFTLYPQNAPPVVTLSDYPLSCASYKEEESCVNERFASEGERSGNMV